MGEPVAPEDTLAAQFRHEFSAACAETYLVCARFVGAEGLSVTYKRIAVEVSFNLLVEYLKRLPDADRRLIVPRMENALRNEAGYG